MKTVKEIFKSISALKKETEKRRAVIQECLEAAGFYALRDRNLDPMLRLFEAVGNETNLRAMGAWIRNAEVIPVHFKDGKPVLSDARQKEMANAGFTEAEYVAHMATLSKWYEKADEGNTPDAGWDSQDFATKVANYLSNAAKKAGKHDQALRALIEQAEIVLRANLNNAEFADAEEATM